MTRWAKSQYRHVANRRTRRRSGSHRHLAREVYAGRDDNARGWIAHSSGAVIRY